MNDTKKELAAELRRLADYADGLASGAETGTEEADINAAISFMIDKPGGDLYTAVHALSVAVCPEKVTEELERLHACTVAAHRKVVERDKRSCYWADQNGNEVELLSIPFEDRIHAVRHKFMTEIGEDFKRECHALAVAARIEADFAEAINDTPRADDDGRKRIKHITYKQAIAILKRLNVPKDRKTLQRWMNGQNTPEDFTPECMLTIQSFTAWATIYAHREQSKINANNALRIDNPNNGRLRKFR